jgi:hypothetical protein
MKHIRFLSVALAIALSAGCSGGHGASNADSYVPASRALRAPRDSGTATVSGVVVDYATDQPLSGMNVSVAFFERNAPVALVATTDGTGAFSFGETPGVYLLAISSPSSAPLRATLHQIVTVVAGANTIIAPAMPTAARVRPTLAQLNRALRLVNLSQRFDDASCIAAVNEERVARGVPPMIVDEYGTEATIALTEQFSHINVLPPLGDPTAFLTYWREISGLITPSLEDFDLGVVPLTVHDGSWWIARYGFNKRIDPVAFGFATSPTTVWYAVDDLRLNGAVSLISELWESDPRDGFAMKGRR